MGNLANNNVFDASTNEHPTLTAIPVEPNEPVYNIPLHYRKMENLHIVFW